MRLTQALLLFQTLATSLVLADGTWSKYTSDSVAYLSCSGYIAKAAAFCDVQKYKCYCKNQPALATMADCYINGFHNSTTKIQYFLDNCESKANVTLTLEKFYASYENATSNDLFLDPTSKSFNATKISYQPVKLSPKTVDRYWESLSMRWFNYNRSIYYGTALIAYWFSVMFVCGLVNWTLYFAPGLASNKLTKTWKKYVSIPAAGRYNHVVDKSFLKFFKWIVPTRLETIIIVLWFAMWIGFETSDIHHVVKDTVWKKKEAEIGRYIADRSAITALFLIPLLVLFAGRNNFMQFITRWSYSRMLTFHRWTSRVTFSTIFIHAISMTCSGIGIGKYDSRNSQPYDRWGITAVVAGGIMLFQSLLFFRRRCYEVFYAMHLILAIIFVIGAWRHTSHEEYGQWLYAATAVWMFDRFIRIVRLISFGAPTATVELKAEETLKVTVKRPSYWKPLPGQHAFIHFMRPLSFWQSHPFTIVDSTTESNTISFFVKIKGGITSNLYQYLSSQPDKTANIRVSVEGPYGSTLPLKRFEKVVFLSGGNGVPGLYSQAMDLLKKNLPNQEVKFYWILRHWKSLDWFYSELAHFENTNIKPIIYCTQPTNIEGLVLPSSSSSIDGSEDSDEKENSLKEIDATLETSVDLIEKLKLSLPYIEFREGRPNTEEIVKEEITSANGSTAFVACAHVNMVDDARKAVANELFTSNHNVEFFDQIQVW